MSILAEIFDTKKAVSEFKELPQEVVEAIPHVNDDARIAAVSQLLERLRREKNATIGKLATITESGPEARPQSDIAADAKLLLDGESLESLGSGQSTVTQRCVFLRRLRALETAIPQAEIRKQEVVQQAIREALERVRPLAEAYERETQQRFEELLSSLKKKAKFYEALVHNGMYRSVRFGHWDLMPIEMVLLFGGSRFQCLEFFLQERRKFWNLDTDEKKKTKKGA